MDKPVFTQKQMKGTIRGKKGNKETLKNVLVDPYVHYWPLVKDKDEVLIRETLQKNLPMIRAPKVPVPWKEIEAVSKERRKEFRAKYTNAEFKPPDESTRASLTFGVNEVTRLLEQDKASSVLVTRDVAPQLMVKHVVDLAVLRNVPILIVSGLRTLLKRCAGIGSVALALAKDLKEGSSLFQINKVIKNVYKNYPVPRNHMNFNRRCAAFFFDECEVDSSVISEGEVNAEDEGEVNGDDEGETEVGDCYLYRKSKLERAFIPLETTKSVVKSNVMEYIGLSGSESKRSEKLEKYKPLVVNRIRSNKNRNQKKIAMLKQRKK